MAPLQGGCITKLEQFLADHLLLMGAVGIGVACLQVSCVGDQDRVCMEALGSPHLLTEISGPLHTHSPPLPYLSSLPFPLQPRMNHKVSLFPREH